MKIYDANEPCPACGARKTYAFIVGMEINALRLNGCARRGPPWSRRTVLLVECRVCKYETERAPLFEAEDAPARIRAHPKPPHLTRPIKPSTAPPRSNWRKCPGCERAYQVPNGDTCALCGSPQEAD